ncbi:hypothetical protein [Bradyrhizobium sp. CCBAU 51627]|uniref:hypothetical protein n=1 Tax=Bradyrhizobium sp. CCBAU 51627 TaxID=1325088 RepID=UPI002306AA76|nr:hypothetical protein [Bradyrhizobium sp. CCBAU 51627]MDA9435684.1 hypothetical protein [Bradyrhizobium sp. CCBAU 51627]
MEEQEALQVIRILVEHGCGPDIDIADAMAQLWFTEAGLHDCEYERGIGFAGDHRWIVLSGWGKFRITQAGLVAAMGAVGVPEVK